MVASDVIWLTPRLVTGSQKRLPRGSTKNARVGSLSAFIWTATVNAAIPVAMVRGDRPKELFTASEVARFCQVDLKTIHNWSDRGEIRHFRTPGRHLRFRRADVLDFLRKYGYPIPETLSDGKPRVLIVSTDASASSSLKRALSKQFEVLVTDDVYCAMITVGHQPPDVVVLDGSLGGPCALSLVSALQENEATRNVRTVLVSDAADGVRKKALDAGASAVVGAGDGAKLRETLEALLGLDR